MKRFFTALLALCLALLLPAAALAAATSFTVDGVTYEVTGTGTAAAKSCAATATNVVIPAEVWDGSGGQFTVTGIAPGFSLPNTATSFTIPDSIGSIPDALFNGATLLSSLVLGVQGKTTLASGSSFQPTNGGGSVSLPAGKTFSGYKIYNDGQLKNATGQLVQVEVGPYLYNLPSGQTMGNASNAPALNPDASGQPGGDTLRVTGLNPGQGVPQGTGVSIAAYGYGMDNNSPREGDLRYAPDRWQVDDASGNNKVDGVFSPQYPGRAAVNTSGWPLGQYVLKVRYNTERYGTSGSGLAWQLVPDTIVSREIPFAIVAASASSGSSSYAGVRYTLTVEGGTGSGQYPAGYVVAIRPNGNAPFGFWEHRLGAGLLASPNSPETTFTMGAGDAVVTARAAALPKTGGQGGGLWAAALLAASLALWAARGRRERG